MMPLLLLGSAFANDVEVEASATLGAQWIGLVGEDAALARLDWIQLPGVRMAQSALEVEVSGPQGTFAEIRVEEGIFHAGALEAGEALVGWSPKEELVLWIGRTDVPVTLDRVREPEDDALSIRPIVSRILLPLHVGGVGMDLAWSEWAQIRGGISYATASVDRPYGWVRADIHPLGPVPARRDEPVDSTVFSVGGSVLQRDSESLGWVRFTTGDVEWRSGPFLLSGAWVQTNQDGDITGSWIAELGMGLPPASWGRLHTHMRYESVTGLEPDEERRHIGTGRLSWQTTDLRFTGYLETSISRETGSVASEDVVDLGRGIERSNDTLTLGGLMRW